MSDLIDRQAAISAICNACGKIDCDKMDKCEKLQLPPANSSEFPNNSDTISRQAAIDAIQKLNIPEDMCVFEIISHIEIEIATLPSAQPEIIRCKDCKHYQFADNRAFGMPVKMCEWFGFKDVDDDDFCSRAERKAG